MTPTHDETRVCSWHAGTLKYLLHSTQVAMREAICNSDSRIFVLNCARRLGKSYLCCVLAVEACLQKPGARVLYIAPTAKQVRTIIAPHMRSIVADAPKAQRPEFGVMDGIWKFPNGSEIQLVGVNNDHADTIRGGDCDLVIIDEAGQIDQLEYLQTSVIKPTLLVTDGRVVMASTPAPTPAHPFTAFCARAQLDGCYAKYTLLDAPHIPRERAEEFIAEDGGRTATSVRREYFCEFVVDDSLAVLPEFSKNAHAIIEAREQPAHFTPLIVGDIGYHDHSFIGFGYHDFAKGVDVIEAEYVTERTLARVIDAESTRIATELWGERKAESAHRFADAPAQVIAELSGEAKRKGQRWNGIAKVQTDGSFLTAATNDLRTRLGREPPTIRVHPRCEKLIAHASFAVWRKPGHDYERLAGFGHFDGVAMLTYFCRLIDRVSDPYPRRAPGVTREHHFMEPEQNIERAFASRWQQPRSGARR